MTSKRCNYCLVGRLAKGGSQVTRTRSGAGEGLTAKLLGSTLGCIWDTTVNDACQLVLRCISALTAAVHLWWGDKADFAHTLAHTERCLGRARCQTRLLLRNSSRLGVTSVRHSGIVWGPSYTFRASEFYRLPIDGVPTMNITVPMKFGRSKVLAVFLVSSFRALYPRKWVLYWGVERVAYRHLLMYFTLGLYRLCSLLAWYDEVMSYISVRAKEMLFVWNFQM